MEKEKILLQLKNKLLPSVKNLENEQATEHDFFPALLWVLLEKSNDSESLLQNISSRLSEELKNTANTIIQNTQESRGLYEEHLNKSVDFISSTTQESDAKLEQFHGEKFRKINDLIESKILEVDRKIEDIKYTQLKTKKKFSIWFLVAFIVQLIILIVSISIAIFLMR